MRRSNIRFFAVAALAALALAACSSSSKGASPATSPTTTTPSSAAGTTSSAPATNSATTVSLATSKFGKIMVDSKGMTLYVDEKDKPGAPACTGGCLTVWPPVAAPSSVTVGPGLTASMFSSVTLTDGTKQLTVNGSPLYTFMTDTTAASGGAAGDAKGQDVAGFYVVAASGKKYDPS